MEMRVYDLISKEKGEKVGTELRISEYSDPNHYLSINVDNNFDLSFNMYKDGKVNYDYEADLILRLKDGDKGFDLFDKMIGDNRNAYYLFDNGSRYAVINRYVDTNLRKSMGFYIFVDSRENLKDLNLPDVNKYGKEDVEKLLNYFYENCDLRARIEVSANEYEEPQARVR